MKFIGDEEIKSIYDIMASAYNNIMPYDYNFFALYEPKEYKNVYKIISEYSEDTKRLDTYNNMEKLINKLCKCVENYTGVEERMYFYYAIIMAIDENIVYESLESEYGDLFVEYKSLNNNRNNICIYNKINKNIINDIDKEILNYEKNKFGIEQKSGLRNPYIYNPNSINANLVNYILIEKNAFGDYEICIHELVDNNTLYQKFKEQKEISIGIVPFIDCNIEEILNIKLEKNAFWIEGAKIEYKKIIVDRFKKNIKMLIESNVDFIVFPEMLLIKEVKDCIDEYILNLDINDTIIIFMGSIYEKKSNCCNVYDNTGELIFQQYKKTPFEYKHNSKEYKELLSNSDKKIHVIDINGIGRIFTFICKDLGSDNLMKVPKLLDANMIIFPAFSQSLDMETFSRSFSEQYNCINVFANACAAFCFDLEKVNSTLKQKESNIGYATIPAKKDGKSSSISQHYKFSKHCVDCRNVCKPRILTISTKTKDYGNNTYSCEINYI